MMRFYKILSGGKISIFFSKIQYFFLTDKKKLCLLAKLLAKVLFLR